MRIPNWLRRLARAAVLVGVLLAGVPVAVYAYGLHLAGPPPPAPTRDDGPPLLAAAVWSSVDGWERCVTPLGLYTAFSRRMCGQQALHAVVRHWLSSRPREGGMMRWHLAGAAARVWLSRHWTADEVTRFLVRHAWVGRRAEGLEHAAAVYFGRSLSSSGPAELLVLAAATTHPRYDPACNAPRNAQRVRYLLRRMREDGLVAPYELEEATAICPLVRMPPMGCSRDDE